MTAQDAAMALAGRIASLGAAGATVLAAAAAAVIYITGGIADAFRFDTIGLPVEASLSVVPRQDLLLLGVRELLLGTLVGAAVVAVVARLSARKVAVLAIVMALIVPGTTAGYLWPVALLAVGLLVQKVGWNEWIIAAALGLGVVATVGRYSNPPYHLAIGEVVRVDTKKFKCGDLRSKAQTCGAFLASTAEGAYVGGPSDKTLVFVPKARIRALVLRPPPASRAPSPSLLGLLADAISPLPRVSITPLGDLWVGNAYHGRSILG
jgi:hypothetical protein